jgi:predicted transcriptional regulator
MQDCEAASRTIIPAFRLALARRLVRERGLSQSRAAALMGIRQASVSNYLSTPRSAETARLAAYISSKGLDLGLVRIALSRPKKSALSSALEKAAADPYLVHKIISTKGLQLMKKTTSERV